MEDVSNYMVNLGCHHWSIVKWILLYLRGMTNFSLYYGFEDLEYIGYIVQILQEIEIRGLLLILYSL